MAQIICTRPGGGINPTENVLPVRHGGIFADSIIHRNDAGDQIYSLPNGFFIDTSAANTEKFGDTFGTFDNGFIQFDHNAGTALLQSYAITFDAYAGDITLDVKDGTKFLQIRGAAITAGAAGAASGQFLILKVNGSTYKINLLNV